MSTTSHYKVYGTLPTMTEQQKEDMLSAKELPSVSSSDNGKVLTVVEGVWAKANVPVELPAVTAEDDGKVLKVVNGAWAAVLETTETTPAATEET